METEVKEFLKESEAKLKAFRKTLTQLKKQFDPEITSREADGIIEIHEASSFFGYNQVSEISLALAALTRTLDSESGTPFAKLLTLLRRSASELEKLLKAIRQGKQKPASFHPEVIEELLSRMEISASAAKEAEQDEAGAQAEANSCQDSSTSPVQADGDSTLNDLAARIVQLEPDDKQGIETVRERLLDLARDEVQGDKVRTLAAEAMLKLDDILYGSNEVPSRELLSDATRLIETALESPPEQRLTEFPVPKQKDEPENREPEVFEGQPSTADADLLEDFITESREYVDAAEVALLGLEINPEDSEAVNTVFRAFHTVKGTAGFLGLTGVSELAHRAETLLSRVRDREIKYGGIYADLALQSIDMLKVLIDSVQDALGGVPMVKPEGYDRLISILERPEHPDSEESFSIDREVVPRLGDLLVANGKVRREEVEAVVQDQGSEPLGVALVKSQMASASDVAKGLRTQRKMSSGLEPATDSSVRVRTDRLDGLIDMVGELVIAHSMVTQDSTVQDGLHFDLNRKVAHTGKIVRELQDLSMSMRMVPVKATFQKIARLVRDLSHKKGKPIRFVTEGVETEIDRNMVEVLRDPLVHMVRNAVDHGIETPAEREAAGKDKVGFIRLSARHSGGNVLVRLEDDGKGLIREKILKTAILRGIIESGKGLSESEVFNLIFKPGFSTADEVTDLSGRGVGMDVVRRNIEALRGRIDVTSEPAKGSSFTMILPLTLAITDGMLVRVGSQRYIIPTINIYITFRPEPQHLSTVAGRGEMVVLRGELMPMFRLHRLFGVTDAVKDPTEGLLVIVGDGDRRCALLVDELLGQQQVVAKSLGEGLGKAQGISGGAILGDGRVGLILDSAEIVSLARENSVEPSNGPPPTAAAANPIYAS